MSNINWKQQFENLFGFDNKEGTYWHILTRVKEARQYGTLTVDDYQEITVDDLSELEAFIETQVIRKIIDEIPNEIFDDSSSFVGLKLLKQQLTSHWLGKE